MLVYPLVMLLPSSIKTKPEQLPTSVYLRMPSYPLFVHPHPAFCGNPENEAMTMLTKPGW